MKTQTYKSIYKSWPFKQAANLVRRFKEASGGPVKFETGYGPSGLPHIGTFAEVARTTWVRNAFEHLTGWPTELIAFSDDMDGLRKVPPNLPEQEMLTENLGKPLCRIPDPFGKYESYSAHMNAKLQELLDRYGYDYRFQSSQEAYVRGDFNGGLAILLQNTDKIKSIILPTIGKEKRGGWSPFFPICEGCGKINSTQVVDYHPEDNTIDYVCDKEGELLKSCGHKGTTTIFDGNVKAGWKTDWALRWYSYGIDYEMYGKDLIDSAKLSSKIIRIIGKQPPAGFHTGLFTDEKGKKISKSDGTGLTVDSWIGYAPLESFLDFIFKDPDKDKKIYWGMVPSTADNYLSSLMGYGKRDQKNRPDSAIWHIYNKGTNVPQYSTKINYSTINNLVPALGTNDKDIVFGYLNRYDPTIKKDDPVMDGLVTKILKYYEDIVYPKKRYRVPTEKEAEMLRSILEKLKNVEGDDITELQTIPFDVARAFNILPEDFFKMFYEVTLGQERGPRFGTFVGILGKEKVVGMLEKIYSQ
jgi:lysyl-tRNA synthetase class 1